MIKFLKIFLILQIITNCQILSGQDRKYYDEFYSALKNLVRLQFPEISQITSTTLSVFKTPYGDYPFERGSIEIPPPPPPPGIVYYNLSSFEYFKYAFKLDSVDAQFMYHSIDSTKTITIDQKETHLKVIQTESYMDIIRRCKNNFEKADSIFESTYGSPNIISVSTPVFNSDYSWAVISISPRIKNKSTVGKQFVMKKKLGTWRIVKERKIVKRGFNCP